MKIREILGRSTFAPRHVMTGDTVVVTTRDAADGTEVVLHSSEVRRSMSFNEAVAFEGEFEGRKSLGGMVLEPDPDPPMATRKWGWWGPRR